MDPSVGGAESFEPPLSMMPLAALDLLAGGLLVGVQATLGCEAGGGVLLSPGSCRSLRSRHACTGPHRFLSIFVLCIRSNWCHFGRKLLA